MTGEADKSAVVLSLCDRSGKMVRPWAEAGYTAIAVDVQHDGVQEERVGDGLIRYVGADVREYEPPKDIRIGFGFPPCTDMAVSGARWFKDKGLPALAEAIELVARCHGILSSYDSPWMIENPRSTLSTHWREPDYKFDPFQYQGYTDEDEAYTKETWLWTGNGFKMPRTDPDGLLQEDADSRIHTMSPSEDRGDRRAETPTGFARAVYLAHEESGYAKADSGFTQPELTEATNAR